VKGYYASSGAPALDFKLLLCMIALGTVVFPQAPPAKRTIIHPGKILDVRSGRMLANQAIVVEGKDRQRGADVRSKAVFQR
jgi:hypothetical protein